jgi:hypothetical protein
MLLRVAFATKIMVRGKTCLATNVYESEPVSIYASVSKKW